MPTLAEVRKQYPELDGLDDQAAVDVLHGTFYPDMSREKVADALGVKPEAPKPAESSRMLDLAKSLKVGIEELPGLATGISDIVPALVYGGRPFTDAADWMGRATGFTPGKWAKETKFSPAYEESAKQIDEAWKPSEAVSADPNASAMDYARALWESAPDLALEYAKHPLYTLNQAAQSLPSMVAGGVLSRGLMTAGRVAEVAARPAAAGAAAVAARKAVPGYLERAVGEKWAPAIAGGVGEGSQQAGQQMDQGSALPDQRANAIAALSSGAIDAVISAGAGRLANRMGLETAETAMAKLGDKAAAEGKPMSRLKRVAGGAASEGVLQEAPQSAQEQMWKNYAEGKPLFEGVARQAIEGGLAGAVMGAGANVMTGRESPPDPRALKLPENGPMSRALNRGLDAEAQQQAAGITPVGGEQPEAPLPPIKMTKAQESSLLAFANHRAAELESKRDGTKESTDEKGNVTPAVDPQFLTPEEEKELAFLKANGGDSQALAHVYQPKKVQKAAKAQRDADKPEPPTGEQQPGDIVAASTGKPFKNIMTATSALDRAGEGHEIIAVKDGLVVRKKAEAPAPSSVGLAKAFDDLKGGGVTDNLYAQLFKALQEGKDTVAGVKDPVLAKAKPAFDAGLIKSPADLRAHVAAGFPASAAPGAQSAAEKPKGESNGQEGASEQGREQGRRRQEGLLTEEQAGAKAAPATPKRVKINDRHVELNADQAAEWDRVAAEYKTKFDDAKATFEREKTQAPPENPDVGLRSAQERYDAKRKALGYQLAAERRRIAGLPTPKEHAAEEKKAAALRTGDAVTFQNEDGTQAAGTITGMAYGKFRVKADDGSTRTMTRDALTKTERSVETATTVTEKAKSKDATTAAAPAEPATQASRAETPAPATAAEPASDAGSGTGKVEAAGVNISEIDNQDPNTEKDNSASQKSHKPKRDTAATKATAAREAARADYFTPGNIVHGYGGADRVISYTPAADGKTWSVTVQAVSRTADGNGYETVIEGGRPARERTHDTEPDAKTLAKGPIQRVEKVAAKLTPEITNTRGGSSTGHELQTAMSSAGWSAEDKGSSNTHWQKHSGKDRYTAILTPARDGKAPRIEVTALDAGGIEVQVSAFDVESAEQAAKSADAAIAKDQHGTGSAKATPKPGANTIFTEDAAAKARELLRKKLGQVSSGIDPEIMQAGITLAGYHIEKGARTFAAYAKAMLADLGDIVKPYLKSWYMGLKFDPRAAAFDGIDGADHVERFNIDTFLASQAAPAAVPQALRDAAKDAGRKQAASVFDWSNKASTTARVQTAVLDRLIEGMPKGTEGLTELSQQITDELKAELRSGVGSTATTQGDTAHTSGTVNTTEAPNADGSRKLEGSGVSPLEGAPAQAVQGAGEGGNAGGSAGSSGAGNVGRDGSPARARLPGTRGVGSGAREAPVPARGTGQQPGSSTEPWVSGGSGVRDGAGQGGRGGEPRGGLSDNPAPGAGGIAAPAFKPQDFRIEDDFALGEGGAKTKYRANVEAIRLLKELQATNRLATPEEQQVLARYVGWGALSQAFDENHADWKREYAELKALLTPEEYEAAKESTQYAHYTSREIVQGIYEAMRHLGFTGGRVAEPGSGVGNFIGLMPEDLRTASRVTGIEREAIAAGIARQLYPQQNIQQADFAKFQAADGYFDAATGNVPFAKTAITDQSGRKHLTGLSVHNYFFAKAIDMLREGGILAQVVTSHFLDSKRDNARRYIADRTRFLGAIRLPNNAFARNAGTEVTTDIVFLQKLPENKWGHPSGKGNRDSWLDTKEVADPRGGEALKINAYFADHPEMMLGQMGRFGTMYGPGQPALIARPGQNTAEMLREAIGRMPAGVYVAPAVSGTTRLNDATTVALSNPKVQEGGHYVSEDKLYRRLQDSAGEARAVQITPETQWTPKTKLGPKFERLLGMTRMRETLRALISAEVSGDKGMESLRKTLNEQYDAFIAKYGRINDRTNKLLFEDDPDFPLLASLEHQYTPGVTAEAAKKAGTQPAKSKADKAPIFAKRVVEERTAPTKASGPSDALTISMAERGRIDSGYIGSLLGRDGEEVLREMTAGDKPVLFLDPASNEYVLRDAYLSGNVRAKLAQAKAAGSFANARALESVQPPDVGAHEIGARIGAPWIPAHVYQDFAKRLFGEGTRATVVYSPISSLYSNHIVAGSDVAASNTYGTPAITGPEILTLLMNNREVKVTYTDADGKLHVDKDATEKANDKAAEIKSVFADWLFQEPERSELLVKAYNETNNNYAVRHYDGSYLNFPGKVPDDLIRFRRHQRNAIARIVQDRTALLDHVVGSGKTYTVVASAMELKRTGLANKSMVVVPNHLVKQWASDFYRLYPGARVLAATKADFAKENRRKFLAKIATGDWDAVVIAHSSFGFIRPAPEFEEAFNDHQIQNVLATISAVQAEDLDERTKKRTVKQLAALKEKLENRIAALRQKPIDALLDFRELGVDQLFVDEAHLFKNLMYSTKMQNVRGLGNAKGSQRAYDLFVKAHQLFAQNGRGQGLVFATGTPVSNSLAEMYHMMRYLMPKQMDDAGFQSFDAWANTFASVEQTWMQKFSGDGYKAENRMDRFVNTHELLKMFDQVADTVTQQDVQRAFKEDTGKEFPLPKLKTGERQPISIQRTPAQRAYMLDIAARAKAIEGKRTNQKGSDNPLSIMGDARKASMDMRLVDMDATEREKGGRIDTAADEIAKRWKQYGSANGVQLVFSDLGTPKKHAAAELKEWEELRATVAKGSTEDVVTAANLGDESAMELVDKAEDAQRELDEKGRDWLDAVKSALRGFSVYDDLRDALIERGIPANQIAFIHDYNTDDQKAALFRKVNAGEIRVLMGSTPKMGAGTNVQERLVALHHLDVPWKPSDVEQREGRIIRQGNRLANPVEGREDISIPGFEAEILGYVTQDMIDLRMWQIQEAKLKMINQLRTRQIEREIENPFEDMELSAGEMQAAATGNMDLLKEIKLRSEITKLERQQRSHMAQANDLITRRRRAEQAIAELPAKIEEASKDAKLAQQYEDEREAHARAFKVTIDGKEYTDASEAGQVLRDMVDARAFARKVKEGGKDVTQTITPEQHAALSEEDQKLWKERAADLSVDFNGKTYTSRSDLGEAFADVRGDAAGAPMWNFDGKTYTRTSALEGDIGKAAKKAVIDEAVVNVGSIGPFSVSVESTKTRSGNIHVEVTVTADGRTHGVDIGMWDDKGGAGKIGRDVVRAAINTVRGMSWREQSYLEDLRKSHKTIAELDKAGGVGEWKGAQRLAQARAEHQAVRNRLATGATAPVEDIHNVGSLAANDTDVVFSRGTPAGASVAPDDLRAQVAEWTKGWKNAPEGGVHVVDGPTQLPRLTRRMDPTARAWFDPNTKAVYLVADRLGSMSEAQFALFHEVYGHYGLRSFLGDDYSDTMMRLRGANDGLSMQAAVWFSRYGQDEIRRRVRAGMSIEKATRYVRLLSTEEALADRAASNEPVSGLKQLLAKVQRALRAIGLNAVADWMENHTDAEVLDLLLQARREVQRGGRAHAFMGADTLFSKDASLADDAQRQIDYLEDRAREAGFSGLDDMVMRDPEAFERAAEQWRAENPVEVLYSRSSTLDALRSGDWRQQASDALNDALRTSTTFNGWWHRTVGTQYHKAQVDSDFARVYHAGQDYLHDTSAFANDAAAFAPDLLPRLESLGDLKRLAYRQADRDALAAPIFQGTLEGTRLTQDELRSRFKLTDKQIGLYNEFRASVDRSLDTLVASDVARYLAVGNDLPRALKDMISDGDVARFKGLVNALLKEKVDSTDQVLSAVRREQRKEMSAFYAEQRKAFEAVKPGGRLAIEQRWEDRKNELQRQHEKALKRAQAEHDKWVKAKRTIDDKYEKVDNLKEQGYAPLMRFGRYTVTQRDTEGNVTYFSMFESEREANQMARELAGDAGHTVERGVMSQEAFKQFRGMTPETMGLFADLAGIEHSDAFQQYLHLAVANRSALKRLIKRKGTAGFSEDVSRVLASFITSNARGASGNLHLGEMSRAVAAIPKAKGDVIDEAVKLRDYLTNPQEEAHQLRGLLFTSFIGGSVASALSNMTQPITTTLPYLSQFSGPLSAARRVAEAMVTAVTGTTDNELRAALAKADKEGVTSPQEIHQLQAESSRGFGNHRGVRAALHVWGSLFALAEQWNRRVSFIAAWETAKDNKLADPFAFASDSTDATQFVYNKGNRPNWARGALGATLFTFKQFSVSYLEMLKRLPTRERAMALAILMLSAGAQGLPFADDLDDMIDSIAQGLGYDFNSKGAKHKFLAQHLGDGGADFVLRGLSAIPGFPLDVAGRMSLGNLIPASGVFLKSKQDKGQEIAEALGPAGGLAQGIGKAMQGDLKGMAPTAIQNLIRAIDMYQTGMYRDSKGRKVLSTDNVDAAIKAIGFQPAQIAREQRKISVGMQQIELAKAVQSEVVSTWAQGIFEKDKDKISEAQKKLREWNENNPESRIMVSRQAIVSQVRAMNMTREERFIKAAPKTMRPTVLAGGGA